MVIRRQSGAGVDREYYDADGRRLTLGEVVDRASRPNGFPYCADKLTYNIRVGAVVGFAIYGPLCPISTI